MARGYNKVILMGNLARDPDVRHTPSKKKVARFTVAVGRQWKNRMTGEVQNQTDFIPIVAWESLADIAERFLRKGKPVLVDGRIQVRDYDDPKTGVRKWTTEVIAENVTLLSAGRRDDDSYGSQYGDIAPPQRDSYGSQGYSQQGYASGRQHPQAPYNAPDAGSLRDDADYEEDFPLDVSALGGGDSQGDDVDVPF